MIPLAFGGRLGRWIGAVHYPPTEIPMLTLLLLLACSPDAHDSTAAVTAATDSADTTPLGVDLDGDGYGADDCGDNDTEVHPGAEDVCDGIDNDCDGHVDDGLSSERLFLDCDGDGGGDYATADTTCQDARPAAPAGCAWVRDGADCDDADPAIDHGTPEVLGDGIDQDCDGYVDDNLVGTVDQDGDGLSEVDGDCDDTNARIYPGFPDSYDPGVDNDCNGCIDDIDSDGDGFTVCLFDARNQGGVDYVPYIDCDDTRADVSPMAGEQAYDGIDNDCDGRDLCDRDADGYSYAGPECYGSDQDDDDCSVGVGSG